jgi:hypothetical protein
MCSALEGNLIVVDSIDAAGKIQQLGGGACRRDDDFLESAVRRMRARRNETASQNQVAYPHLQNPFIS